MKLILATLAVAMLATAAPAQSVTMPAEVVLNPDLGLPLSVTIEWEGDSVGFTESLGDEVMIIRAHSDDPKRVKLVVFVSRGAKSGTYYLQAAACKAGKMTPFKSTKVVVKGETPPTPPVPPTPVPDSTLVKALKAAYASDTHAGKADNMSRLAAVHKASIKIVEAGVATAQEFQDKFMESKDALIPDRNLLLAERKVIQAELQKVFPADLTQPLGDPARVKATLQTISDAIKEAIK